MKVLKFGGTSVGTPQAINKVIEIIKNEIINVNDIWVVISAFSGVTDALINLSETAALGDSSFHGKLNNLENRHIDIVNNLFLGEEKSIILNKIHAYFSDITFLLYGVFLLKEISKKSLDLLMSYGEILSTYILTEYAKTNKIDSIFVDSRKFIITDDTYGNAKINYEKTEKNLLLFAENNKNKVKFITGFIASSENNITTTLGRGGSDYTASIIGNIFNAEEILIYSDVDGVMTADPKKVKKAFPIEELSFEEAMELSHFGAKVLYPPTIQPAKEKNIPIRLLNTFNSNFKGTLVGKNLNSRKYLIKGISSIPNIAIIRIQGSGMIGVSGIAKRLFQALAKEKINVIMITQASSEHSICVAIIESAADIAQKAIEKEFELEILANMIDHIIVEKNCSIIAVVGENMRNTLGVAGNLFSALARNGINVSAIAQGSSELNISIVVSKDYEIKALNTIHETFFFSSEQIINLFIIGTGLIGKTLLKQIASLKNSKFNLKIVGLANSKKMIFDENGIDINNFEKILDNSEKRMNINDFIEEMKNLNLPYSIFVDCTASKEIADKYPDIFKLSASIVTPNKLANVDTIDKYKELRNLMKKFHVQFFYETNVGAGLPIINTLKDLIYSGDKILKIEGIFSGTISYIFNEFNKNITFSEVVKNAMKKGYTEPDPRIDLSGKDAARKLLILIRELGFNYELEDIKIENILPEKYSAINTVEEFLNELEKDNNYFYNLYSEAEKEGKVLRYIASFNNKCAELKLEKIDKNHPFYTLQGSDNIISFTTERYCNTPLVIKGAGAGAEVTAAGVLSDIFKVADIILKY